MSAKELLNGAYLIELRIAAKEDQIKDLRERAEKVTTMMSDMPRGGGARGMDDIVAKIADLKTEIANDTKKLIERRKTIRCAINELDDIRFQTVLELRYLNGLEWDELARKIGYERRYILKIHGWALKELDKIDTKRHFMTP